MKRTSLARVLCLAGALQAVGVGCSDDPVVGARDVLTDLAVDLGPSDVVTPSDNPSTPDAAQPDAAQPDAAQPDVAPSDVVEDTTPDGATDGAADAVPTDAGDDAAPDVVVEDVAPDAPADVMVGECATSADCARSMGGPVCDTVARRCVPCTTAEDVCPVGNYCASNRCVPGCRSEMDCTGSMRCDTASHMCVGCVADGDCAIGTVCRSNACVPGCGPGRGCGAGSTCCGTACVNTQTDTMNCGACGK